MRKVLLLGSAAALLTAFAAAPSTASAQEEGRTYFNENVPAPTNAFELGVASGYTQPFGNVAPGRSARDAAGAGVAFELGLGYRVNPSWMVGVYGDYQELGAGNFDDRSRGLVAGVNAAYHFAPYTRLDPWVKLGTGYRALWEVNPGTTPNVMRQGWEIAKLNLGADLRVSESVALGPMIGADVNMFLYQMPSGGTNVALSSAQYSTFVYAGLQGTFDLGGAHEAAPVPVVASQR